MQWDEHDRDFDWHTATLFGAGGTKSYADIAQDRTTNQSCRASALLTKPIPSAIRAFRAKGGKVLSYVGAYDRLIMHRGVISITATGRALYSEHCPGGWRGGPIDFTNVQKFYRLFRIPAAGHCARRASSFSRRL